MEDISLELKNLEAIFRSHERWLRPEEVRPRNPFAAPVWDEEDPYSDVREAVERKRAS